MYDVSVIFVNYNSTKMLIEAIDSVINLTSDCNYEIIVVDNASPDNGAEVLEEYYGNRIVLLRSSKNLGFGGANNLGASKAKGEFLFFLNPDTKLLNNSLLFFVDYFKSKHLCSVGAVGSLLLDVNLLPVHSYGKFLTPFNVLLYSLPLKFRDKTDIINAPKAVEYITGADLFMPTKIFNRLGGFDTSFFMYSEEVDLQYRLSKEGYSRMIIPGPEIIHYDGGSYKNDRMKASARRRYEKDKSRMLYIKKHYGTIVYFSFKMCMLFIKLPVLVNRRYRIRDNVRYLEMIASI